ncbi:hypothetical protein C823_006186 [Eubacterium plexicaudatum ASF492]|uniref:HU domain-containing protein n=1 Tax=Eubacterium plexicaudatum ASF492 TaxID=1235802 RepID=N2ARI8_9FIRM|nr:hypothetical protein C823_006186 [Eubacterium plexicaudatum ASF492]
MRKENLITYNQADLIKEISEDYPSYSEDNIKNILESLEIHVKEHLSESELEHPVQVKLFFGLSLLGWIVPAANKNCFGMNVKLNDRIRIKPKLTRYFIRKVNELAVEAK